MNRILKYDNTRGATKSAPAKSYTSDKGTLKKKKLIFNFNS